MLAITSILFVKHYMQILHRIGDVKTQTGYKPPGAVDLSTQLNIEGHLKVIMFPDNNNFLLCYLIFIFFKSGTWRLSCSVLAFIEIVNVYALLYSLYWSVHTKAKIFLLIFVICNNEHITHNINTCKTK